MPRKLKVKRGEEFLPDVSISQLSEMQRKEPPGKSRDRLKAAKLRKRDWTLDRIADIVEYAKSTVHGWLLRMQEEGLERRHDHKSPGRPPRLSGDQISELDGILRRSPTDSGMERGSWTAKMVARIIQDRFGAPYGPSGALKLTARMNFSVRKTRPVPYNTATPEEIGAYVTRTVEAIRSHARLGYSVVCLDAAGLADSPSSSLGIRPRGGSETVGVNFSTKTTRIIGALGAGTLDVQFHEKADAPAVIALIEYVRRKRGKIFVILDNASSHKSKEMADYIRNAGDEVVLWFLPPRTPQHNPIEVMWREIKRAIAGIYFGGIDQMMRTAIIRMLRRGEVAIVSLFRYMLEAMDCGSPVAGYCADHPARPPDRMPAAGAA